MRKYKFVKIDKIEHTEDFKPMWFFVPQSVEDIKEHWKKYPCSVISEGSRLISSKIFNSKKITHSINDFEKAVTMLNQVTRNNIIFDMAQIETEAYNNRIQSFENGRSIYLTHGMQVYTLDERFFRIVEEVYKDELTFPDEDKPSFDDVRYIQWEGGRHWYAKIGNLDVLDKGNNQKWNTKEEAEKAAKWYIEKNWS